MSCHLVNDDPLLSRHEFQTLQYKGVTSISPQTNLGKCALPPLTAIRRVRQPVVQYALEPRWRERVEYNNMPSDCEISCNRLPENAW